MAFSWRWRFRVECYTDGSGVGSVGAVGRTWKIWIFGDFFLSGGIWWGHLRWFNVDDRLGVLSDGFLDVDVAAVAAALSCCSFFRIVPLLPLDQINNGSPHIMSIDLCLQLLQLKCNQSKSTEIAAILLQYNQISLIQSGLIPKNQDLHPV